LTLFRPLYRHSLRRAFVALFAAQRRILASRLGFVALVLGSKGSRLYIAAPRKENPAEPRPTTSISRRSAFRRIRRAGPLLSRTLLVPRLAFFRFNQGHETLLLMYIVFQRQKHNVKLFILPRA